MKITKNKSLEIDVLQKGWHCIIDSHINWTTRGSGDDHWGLTFYLVLFGVKIIDFALVDIRHNDE